MKCEYCGQEEPLPFKCSYCGKYFCVEHRLPESHSCEKIFLAASPSQKEKVYEPKFKTFGPIASRKLTFSRREKIEIAFATAIVCLVGLSFLRLYDDIIELTVVLLAFSLSFLAHEIAHKIVALREGLIAFFKLDIIGTILTIVSIFSPLKIVAPGAVIISGYGSTRTIGKISLSGPLTNILIGSTSYLAGFAFTSFSYALNAICLLNFWIAIFNLIPFSVLDGRRIYEWNRKIWAAAFIISLSMLVSMYFL
ncbi:MAG: AN1-type zinc finger domain-containing protein [Nitrososphaeria archaeon]